MKTVAIITPTVGSKFLEENIWSVISQTYKNIHHYVIVDGPEYDSKVDEIFAYAEFPEPENINLSVTTLPRNVGKAFGKPFYGHRVYGAFPYLINEDYVMYLDEDNWIEPEHIERCIEVIDEGHDWVYSLRRVIDQEGNFVCNDDCESLGKWEAATKTHHIDTSCFFLPTSLALGVSHLWHNGNFIKAQNGSYAADRYVANALLQQVKNVECTGMYTVNYRADNNSGSVAGEFFLHHNKIMEEKYPDGFPWRR